MTEGAVALVECPDCGVGRVAATEVTLRGCVGRDAWEYRARCPWCRTRFVAPTTASAAHAALGAGARLEYWELPAELAERPAGGPRLTLDDVERTARLLADDAALHAALRGLAPH
ncbi:MAG: hypothetical protein KatS3mg009_0540 [Acidimicrobiia bacterium]|nr:MAG: hypothetical protein KatS3mg009_0540 [Acidimicrobiia bacterium]